MAPGGAYAMASAVMAVLLHSNDTDQRDGLVKH